MRFDVQPAAPVLDLGLDGIPVGGHCKFIQQCLYDWILVRLHRLGRVERINTEYGASGETLVRDRLGEAGAAAINADVE
jgi:hypothetical protein